MLGAVGIDGVDLQLAVGPLEDVEDEDELLAVNVEAEAFTNEQIDKYIRKDCSDDLWVPTTLPPALLDKLKLC